MTSPTDREIRAWAARVDPGLAGYHDSNGIWHLAGRLPEYVLVAWNKAHPDALVPTWHPREHKVKDQPSATLDIAAEKGQYRAWEGMPENGAPTKTSRTGR